MKIVVLAAALAAVASPCLAAVVLPDGIYDCTLDGQYLAGSMEIVGTTYKGPSFDEEYEGTYNFTVGDEGGLFFDGPVGGYTDPGYQLVGALAVREGDHVAIELHVKQDDVDYVHYVTCSPRG